MPGNSAIDFARSSITWLLPEQPSYGRFAIDASLTLSQGETFYLCAQVFAGNVYGEEALFKDPPYGFSAAFSNAQYRIFRDAVRDPALEDTFGDAASRFRDLRFDIQRAACRRWEPASLAGPSVTSGPLSARLRITGGELAGAVLEFPLRHVNAKATPPAFQIETGPVLIAAAENGVVLPRLRRAFVMLGRTDRAEFLFDDARPAPVADRWRGRMTVACESELLQSA
jgi:hypothetical protein